LKGDEFDWDDAKASLNRRKHRVSFEEASTIFDDPNRLTEYDVDHSDVEDRWLLIGLSNRFRLLTVAYTKRNEKIRIISARRANQRETRRYAGET